MASRSSAHDSTAELIRKLQEAIANSAPQNPVAELLQQAIEEIQRLAQSGWLPIETAPTDGTCVLVYPPLYNNRTCSIAKYNTNEYAKKPRPYWERDDDLGRVTLSRDTPPTHWMPMPARPKE